MLLTTVAVVICATWRLIRRAIVQCLYLLFRLTGLAKLYEHLARKRKASLLAACNKSRHNNCLAWPARCWLSIKERCISTVKWLHIGANWSGHSEPLLPTWGLSISQQQQQQQQRQPKVARGQLRRRKSATCRHLLPIASSWASSFGGGPTRNNGSSGRMLFRNILVTSQQRKQHLAND